MHLFVLPHTASRCLLPFQHNDITPYSFPFFMARSLGRSSNIGEEVYLWLE